MHRLLLPTLAGLAALSASALPAPARAETALLLGWDGGVRLETVGWHGAPRWRPHRPRHVAPHPHRGPAHCWVSYRWVPTPIGPRRRAVHTCA